jgi:lipopolysaccharide transport system permease protein
MAEQKILQEEEFVIEPATRLAINLKELWHYRELFYFFTWRDIKVKYRQTILGLLWVMIQPLFMMLIFTFIFGDMVQKPDELPYPVFAFSGLLLWTFFSSSVTTAGNSMVSHAAIIKKIYFPRIIIPLSAMLASLVDLVITFLLFVVFLFFFPVSVNPIGVIVYWPAALLLSIMAAVGLGCWLSALTVKYRDFRFVIGFVMQAAFFITPIVYPATASKYAFVKYMMALNPMYAAITIFRLPMTAATPDTTLLSISIVSSCIVLLIGFGYFKKTELFFADLA